MEIGETLRVRSWAKWGVWLRRHHADRKEIWLVYYKKGSGRAGIGYDESVEEALCFGWIDGQAKGLDAVSYASRFTPRQLGSNWSASNRERAIRLLREGRMTAAGRRVLLAELLLAAAGVRKSGPRRSRPTGRASKRAGLRQRGGRAIR
jgi:uncharacterized protein YdeI (YjbR/CyaY-like superfamily)